MKWFGPDWGAPVCRSTPQVLTPEGVCHACDEPITQGCRGLVLPHVAGTPENPSLTEAPFHLECFLLSVGAIKEVHILHHGTALCGLAGIPSEWPEGHRWVRLEETKRATCSACKAAASLVGAGT